MLKGVVCSLTASMLFGYMYYFSTKLVPLSGKEIFAFRIIFTLPFILGAVFLFKQQKFLTKHFRRIYAKPWILLIFMATASITGFEMWLFLWAPNNNQALNVSVGYLILPLSMVVIGKIFFKEHISSLKFLAILSATIGIGVDIFFKGGGSWASIAVCAYSIYFLLRKHFNIMDLASLLIEFTLLLPLCLYFASQTPLTAIQQANPNILWQLVILGLLSGTAFIFYILASNMLPMNMLGLLGYAEPILLLVNAVLIGEKITPESYPLLLGLIGSIFFVMADGVQVHRKIKQKCEIDRINSL